MMGTYFRGWARASETFALGTLLESFSMVQAVGCWRQTKKVIFGFTTTVKVDALFGRAHFENESKPGGAKNASRPSTVPLEALRVVDNGSPDDLKINVRMCHFTYEMTSHHGIFYRISQWYIIIIITMSRVILVPLRPFAIIGTRKAPAQSSANPITSKASITHCPDRTPCMYCTDQEFW